jgi:YD repeat-containing protein
VPTGIETVTAYDDAGRVARVSNPARLVAAYAYDERGDVAKLTRADGEVSFEYSGERQPIVMDDPTGTTGWVYDEVGRLLEQTDARGDTLTSTYTAAGLRVPRHPMVRRTRTATTPPATADGAWILGSGFSLRREVTYEEVGLRPLHHCWDGDDHPRSVA